MPARGAPRGQLAQFLTELMGPFGARPPSDARIASRADRLVRENVLHESISKSVVNQLRLGTKSSPASRAQVRAVAVSLGSIAQEHGIELPALDRWEQVWRQSLPPTPRTEIRRALSIAHGLHAWSAGAAKRLEPREIGGLPRGTGEIGPSCTVSLATFDPQPPVAYAAALDAFVQGDVSQLQEGGILRPGGYHINKRHDCLPTGLRVWGPIFSQGPGPKLRYQPGQLDRLVAVEMNALGGVSAHVRQLDLSITPDEFVAIWVKAAWMMATEVHGILRGPNTVEAVVLTDLSPLGEFGGEFGDERDPRWIWGPDCQVKEQSDRWPGTVASAVFFPVDISEASDSLLARVRAAVKPRRLATEDPQRF